ncbi:MAG: hypothetical protein H7288_02470 [Kineosporiaceae bacterium]|nr:hypothetical protein [Aeromicrobium sp.]
MTSPQSIKPDSDLHSSIVDGIPVLWSTPKSAVALGRLALWLPFLGGTKEIAAPFLRRLSDAGYLAMSLDPWQHGERSTEATPDLMARVFGEFRRHMWPILGQTTLDALRIADWAIDTHNLSSDVVAGGVSMGGDISVALACVDPRVKRVAAIAATPDWTRPGMTQVGQPEELIDQGSPSPYGEWLYTRLNPFTNPIVYRHAPAIAFELGGDDTHVPPTGAARFKEVLAAVNPAAAANITITVHEGLDHLSAARNPKLEDRAFAWLTS